ncbi:hypothetical protein C7R88_12040 [Plesiomonas shigelloides]|nr:hypothetical protein C7R88_12040 [Plesiomonas shigelloides]
MDFRLPLLDLFIKCALDRFFDKKRDLTLAYFRRLPIMRSLSARNETRKQIGREATLLFKKLIRQSVWALV